MVKDYSEYTYQVEHSPIYAALTVDLEMGQSRKLSQLINFLNPFRPVKSNNNDDDGDD